MKKIITIVTLMLIQTSFVLAQNTCWQSNNYVCEVSNKKKICKTKATFCFTSRYLIFNSEETGLVKFFYEKNVSYQDSATGQVYWGGAGGKFSKLEYSFTMLYNKYITIQRNDGGSNWSIIMYNIHLSGTKPNKEPAYKWRISVPILDSTERAEQEVLNSEYTQKHKKESSYLGCFLFKSYMNLHETIGSPYYTESNKPNNGKNWNEKFKNNDGEYFIIYGNDGNSKKIVFYPTLKIAFNKDSTADYYNLVAKCPNEPRQEAMEIKDKDKLVYLFGRESWALLSFYEKQGFVEKIVIK